MADCRTWCASVERDLAGAKLSVQDFGRLTVACRDERCVPTAALQFNFAIALEDQGNKKAALAQYEQCLKLSPDLAVALFNAAHLHEAMGHAQMALPHFSAYRRLKR